MKRYIVLYILLHQYIVQEAFSSLFNGDNFEEDAQKARSKIVTLMDDLKTNMTYLNDTVSLHLSSIKNETDQSITALLEAEIHAIKEKQKNGNFGENGEKCFDTADSWLTEFIVYLHTNLAEVEGGFNEAIDGLIKQLLKQELHGKFMLNVINRAVTSCVTFKPQQADCLEELLGFISNDITNYIQSTLRSLEYAITFDEILKKEMNFACGKMSEDTKEFVNDTNTELEICLQGEN